MRTATCTCISHEAFTDDPCECCGSKSGQWCQHSSAAPRAVVASLRSDLAAALARAEEAERERDEARASLARFLDVERQKAAAESALSASRAEVEQMRGALAFAACVIRCGEPWTETCEQKIGAALARPAGTDADNRSESKEG